MKTLTLLCVLAISMFGSLGTVGSPGTYLSAASSTVTLSLSAEPPAGDYLLACISVTEPGRAISTPSGWAVVDSLEDVTSFTKLYVFGHTTGASEGMDFPFSITGGDSFTSGVLWQITGQDAVTPVNQHDIADGGNGTTISTPSKTPSVIGTLALSCASSVYGTAGPIAPVTASAGWTMDASLQPQYNATVAASRDSLTTDTITAITMDFTLSAGPFGSVTAIVLIAPANVGLRRIVVITQ